jgi:hypothetical protein
LPQTVHVLDNSSAARLLLLERLIDFRFALLGAFTPLQNALRSRLLLSEAPLRITLRLQDRSGVP